MKLHPTEQANANLARANRNHEGAPRALTHCGGRYRLRHCAGEGALLFSARALFNSHRVVGPALGGAMIRPLSIAATARHRNDQRTSIALPFMPMLSKPADTLSGQERTLMKLYRRPKPVLEKEAHSES